MKVLMILAACLLSSNLLLADQVNDESGVAVKAQPFHYAGQSNLMTNQEAKVRKPASVDPMQKYYRFFDSKEDKYKNLY
ncbi:MAG: hypothetical protein WCQ53_04520 [bacterium]